MTHPIIKIIRVKNTHYEINSLLDGLDQLRATLKQEGFELKESSADGFFELKLMKLLLGAMQLISTKTR